MEHRRIQLVGKRSYAISLPKEWIIEKKLKQKDVLYIEETSEKDLLIKASQTLRNENNIQIPISEITDMFLFLDYCFTREIHSLAIISSKPFSLEQIRIIKKTLRKFEGFEIIEEEEKKVTLEFLFGETQVKFQQIIRRMFFTLEMELQCLEKKNKKTLDELEDNIDKLYTLAKKILFLSSKNSIYRLKNEITSIEDILFLRIFISKIENISDIIIDFYDELVTPKNIMLLNKWLSMCRDLWSKKKKFTHNDIMSFFAESKIQTHNKSISILHLIFKDAITQLYYVSLTNDMNAGKFQIYK